jgi:hypothetical protein
MENLINIIKKIRYNEKLLINSSSLGEEELHYILRDYRNNLREFDKYSELIEQIEKIDFL